jgi:hypothetical protein
MEAAARRPQPLADFGIALSTRLPGLLATPSAPDAEARLQRSFDSQLAGQADLKSAARR